MPHKGAELKKIVAEAKRLRKAHPKEYGVKGAEPGKKGHVKGGWQKAVKAAAKKV